MQTHNLPLATQTPPANGVGEAILLQTSLSTVNFKLVYIDSLLQVVLQMKVEQSV